MVRDVQIGFFEAFSAEKFCEESRPVPEASGGLLRWFGYPSAGCSAAEPASVSPDIGILLRFNQRVKQHRRQRDFRIVVEAVS